MLQNGLNYKQFLKVTWSRPDLFKTTGLYIPPLVWLFPRFWVKNNKICNFMLAHFLSHL